MTISKFVLGTAFALSLLAGGDALAASVSGKVDKVENEGRQVTIAGTEFRVSGSRTKVMIGGQDADRGQIKVGMECTAEGEGEATMISCK